MPLKGIVKQVMTSASHIEHRTIMTQYFRKIEMRVNSSGHVGYPINIVFKLTLPENNQI